MVMDAVAKVFDGFDVIVAPTSGEQLVITNLTGHPAVILPNGLRGNDALNRLPATSATFKTPTAQELHQPDFLGKLAKRSCSRCRALSGCDGIHLRHPADLRQSFQNDRDHRRPTSFLNGISHIGPIRRETCGQREYAAYLESHSLRAVNAGRIWGIFQRAAAAVNNQIRCARQSSRPFFKLRQSLLSRSRAVKRSARDVSAGKERAEAHIDDGGRRLVLFTEFMNKIARLNDLR